MKLLKLKIGAKKMLRVNVDMQDRIINGQTRNISQIKFDQGIVRKVSVKFYDEKAGLKAIKSSYLGRKKLLGSYLKCEAEIPIKKGSASQSIKRTQFPLILTWAYTVHKFQG